MKKRLMLVCVAAFAIGISIPSHAESICADAGTTNPARDAIRSITGISMPTMQTPAVCVPIP